MVAVIVLSMDLTPLSRALPASIPPLRSFRVPARAALPLIWALSILSVAALTRWDRTETPAPVSAPRSTRRRRKDRTERRRPMAIAWREHLAWLGIPLAILLFVAPPTLRDAAALALVVAAVTVLWRGGTVPVAMILLVLGTCSVSAFRERLLPFPEPPRHFAEADSLGAAVRRIKPELDSTLSRVRLDLEIPVFTVNSAYAAGLASLDGYGAPTGRFSRLVFALRGDPYQPTANFFKLPSNDPAFSTLRQLYNVGWNVTLPARGRLALTPLGPTAGPAWFSASTTRLNDLTALARELRAAGDSLAHRASEVLWLDNTDPLAARADVPPTLDPRCREAQVHKVSAPRRSHEIVAHDLHPRRLPPDLRHELHRRPPRHRRAVRRPPHGPHPVPRLRRADGRGGSRRNGGAQSPRRPAKAPLRDRLGRARPHVLRRRCVADRATALTPQAPEGPPTEVASAGRRRVGRDASEVGAAETRSRPLITVRPP